MVNVDKARAVIAVIAQHQIGLQGDDVPSDTFKIVLQIIRFRAGIDNLDEPIALQARLDQPEARAVNVRPAASSALPFEQMPGKMGRAPTATVSMIKFVVVLITEMVLLLLLAT